MMCAVLIQHIHTDGVCCSHTTDGRSSRHTPSLYVVLYTATHCNALQHTATHCNTLQRTATHCNTLQHTAIHCNTLQHNMCVVLIHNMCVVLIQRMLCLVLIHRPFLTHHPRLFSKSHTPKRRYSLFDV